VIIDAWMQHPSAEFLAEPMFLHGNAERVFGLGQGPAGITG
jgi:hypothetical protein